MSTSVDIPESPDLTREKVKELSEAVKKLKGESKRLQVNLDRMHQLQATLYQTDMKLVEWVEAGNRLKDVHIHLEKTAQSQIT